MIVDLIVWEKPTITDIIAILLSSTIGLIFVMYDRRREGEKSDSQKMRIYQNSAYLFEICTEIYQTGNGVEHDDSDSDDSKDGDISFILKEFLIDKYDIMKQRHDDLVLNFQFLNKSDATYDKNVEKIQEITTWIMYEYIKKIQVDPSLALIKKLHKEFRNIHYREFKDNLKVLKEYNKKIHA